MGRQNRRKLLWTGLLLSAPLLFAIYQTLAKPGDVDAMQWLIYTGVPGAPGLICILVWGISGSRPSLPEDEIATDAAGRPDLSRYDKPLAHYEAMYGEWLEIAAGKKSEPKERALAHRKRAHALWGMVAKGIDAIPFVTTLLQSPKPEAQADGHYLYHELSNSEDALAKLVNMSARPWTLDSLRDLVEALGAKTARQAIPLLARLLAAGDLDARLESTATAALGLIVDRTFETAPDARDWLDQNVDAGTV